MLTSYILRMAEAGDQTLFIEEGVYRSYPYTYASVIERSLAFARWLQGLKDRDQARGAAHGEERERVMLWAPPSARWAMAFYGCVLAGRVVVPVDAGFSADFVRRVVQHTGASLLIRGEGFSHPSGIHAFPDLAGDASPRDTTAPRPLIGGLGIPELSLRDLDALPPVAASRAAGRNLPADVVASGPDSLLEIIYTSGTTAEPRGVMITHGNVLANLGPIEREIHRYRLMVRVFRPLRFLHLIPLSHLFGQVMGLFIPQLLRGVVVFPESQSPAELARAIRRRRVSVMVSVPQQLEALGNWAAASLADSRQQIVDREKNQKSKIRNQKKSQETPEVDIAAGQGLSVLERMWRFRRLHGRLGWKMWAFVVGGAALAPQVESLWNRLGFAVIQGYGLTETAPVVTLTHPFTIRHGSVGRALPGAEIRLAPDGEILVRGPNVTPGYYRDDAATHEAFADGWLRTGDLGRFDGEGNLIYVGRKKDVIVTADGLNVVPEDVEQALNRQPGVAEAAVVPRVASEARASGRALVHAVIVPEAGAEAAALEAAVARANELLEPHQRIRSYSVWPDRALPRTVSTRKVQRSIVAAWVASGASEKAASGAASAAPSTANGLAGVPQDWKQFLTQLGVAAERLQPAARLSEDLGLTSLDRAELLTWLETHGYSVDGARFTRIQTVAQLDDLVRTSAVPATKGTAAREFPSVSSPMLQASAEQTATDAVGERSAPPKESKTKPFRDSPPQWPRRWPARVVRELAQWLLIFPLLRLYAKLDVEGAEKLERVSQPVLWVANHQSILDVPVILRGLPARLRRRVAPVMAAEALLEPTPITSDAWLHVPGAEGEKGLMILLARLFFDVYVLTDDPNNVQAALRHAGQLAEQGYSTLIFPEGERTSDGRVVRFRPGVGLMAERLELPVIPLRLEGLDSIWNIQAAAPTRGRACLSIGAPLWIERDETPAEFTARLENLYRNWK